MPTLPNYRIVSPSHRRPHNMRKLLSLVPSVTVCIDEREVDDYAPHVPKGQLWLHPPTENVVQARNWIQQNCGTENLIQMDDDLDCVRFPRRRRGKKTTDPNEILQIIENAVQIATDVDLGVASWGRTMNAALWDPDYKTISLNAPIDGTFLIRGHALSRVWWEEVAGRADADFSLQTLMEDRIMICDCRFYFDHGKPFSGKGGTTVKMDEAYFAKVNGLLKSKWGDGMKTVTTQNPMAKKLGASMAVRVPRRNPSAIR